MITRVLIADDHAVFRDGLRELLDKQPDIRVVGETGDGEETLRAVETLSPDVLLLDLSMPGMSGPEVARGALRLQPDLAIVVLTMHDDRFYLQELFGIGARAFVLKKSTGTDLVQAIRAVTRGARYVDPSMTAEVLSSYLGRRSEVSRTHRPVLTPREDEVCRLLACGHTNAEVADRLCISRRTVETHRSRIMAKLGLRNRADLVRLAIERGLLRLH